jgi:RES domain-containing protein
VSTRDLESDWLENAPSTRAIGDAWLTNAATALLAVPSALVPDTSNVLLNPAHPQARRIAIVSVSDHVLDPRLLR